MIPATFRHSRENGNLESLKLQLTFEYCRRPKVWIPACAGMTAEPDGVKKYSCFVFTLRNILFTIL